MREWKLVPLEQIAEVWILIIEWVDKACEFSYDKYSPSDFLKVLLEDRAQLWVGRTDQIIEAAAITDVIDFPNRRYARITMGMGNPDDLYLFIETFENWARAVGCHGAQSEMRPGFFPPFVKAGWSKTHILMEKEF